MEINFGENPLIENPNQVYHNHTLRGKGTKESPLKVSVDGLDIAVDSDTLAGDGTPGNPLTVIPDGAILAEDGSPILTEDGEFLIQEGYIDQSSVKRYTALISQESTDDPVPIILENTFGETLVWGYTDTGIFTVQSNGAFTLGKTWFCATPSVDSVGNIGFVYDTASSAYFAVVDTGGNPVNGFTNLSIEIRVYP